MIFLKQIGFLLLMAVLGAGSLLLHFNGYPLAWAFHSDQSYWLPIMFGINLVVIAALLAGIFWLMRGFLFGRGRPYLAWFAMVCWALVWLAVAVYAATTRTAWWPGLWHAGAESLEARLDAARRTAGSVSTAENQSADKREVICTKAFLEEAHSLTVVSDGLPVNGFWPENFADENNLFQGPACSDDLKAKYRKYLHLKNQVRDVVSADVYVDNERLKFYSLNHAVGEVPHSANTALMSHPDAISALAAIDEKYKDDPVGRKLAQAELKLRIFSNGQVKDHQWVQMPGQTGRFDTKAVYINPQSWNAASKDSPSVTRWAWVRLVKASGEEEILLQFNDCEKKATGTRLELFKNSKGQDKLLAYILAPQPVLAGTWGNTWLNFICKGKMSSANSQ